jgi:hypothetical protein
LLFYSDLKEHWTWLPAIWLAKKIVEYKSAEGIELEPICGRLSPQAKS